MIEGIYLPTNNIFQQKYYLTQLEQNNIMTTKEKHA